MTILNYKKKHHKKIIAQAVTALREGKTVVYPTDTSYGLGVDATNLQAIIKLYRLKGREFKKPVHIISPSLAYARKICRWNEQALKLAKQFWPGALTIVLGLRAKSPGYRLLSAKSDNIGLRMPKNNFALDLAKALGKPITATSANPSSLHGGTDAYSLTEIEQQFENKKFQPDLIINAGKLKRRKPSTVVKIDNHQIKILRKGPISEKQIKYVLQT